MMENKITMDDVKNNKNEQKIVSVSIVGLTNSGKSTLLNKLIEVDLACVSSKAQTTRKSIIGIKNFENTQIILLDTPGPIMSKKRGFLEKTINKDAKTGLISSPNAILVIDPKVGLIKENLNLIYELIENKINIIFFINKNDIKENKSKTASIMQELSNMEGVDYFNVFYGSARKGQGLKNIFIALETAAYKSPWIYDQNEFTSEKTEVIVAQKFRAELFERLNQEIPYAINIEASSIKYLEDKTEIQITVHCERESQKKIIIGKDANNIKKAIQNTIHKIKDFVLKPKINVFVRHSSNWKEKTTIS